MSSTAILVVAPSWVGDMVLAQSLLKILRDRQPTPPIDVLAPAWSAPLLARMPEVRETLVLPVGHGELALLTRYRLARSLRGRYDEALVLPNSFKAALIPFWAKIPHRTGFIGEWRWGLLNEARRLDKQQLPRTVDRFAALGLPEEAPLPAPLPLPDLCVPSEEARSIQQRFNLPQGHRGILALCPGAEYGPAKQWPPTYFAAVAQSKAAEGWQIWVLGGKKEYPLGEEIATLVGPTCLNLAGRTTLDEAVALLSLASAVVSNDSGLMHVAAALNRPLIAVFGSSDPHATPPLRGKAISLELPCSPCFKRHCPNGQEPRCLHDLKPIHVITALDAVEMG